ncbi:MAG: DUF4240 domain-containing protein [Polyangiaceae bacterium]
MSYQPFTADLEALIVERQKKGLPALENDEYLYAVRDVWLGQRRLSELVSFTVQNWDCGNGDEFMRPIIEALVEARQVGLLKMLLTSVIQQRCEQLAPYVEKGLSWRDLDTIDVTGFNMFATSSYEDHLRAAAFHRRYTLEAFDTLRSALARAGAPHAADPVLARRQSVFEMQKRTPAKTSDRRNLDEATFWALIADARQAQRTDVQFVAELECALTRLRAGEIPKFQRLLDRYLAELHSWDVWAVAHLWRGGCGDDEFDYFKAWAVARGREVFESVRTLNVGALRSLITEEPQLESLLGVAHSAYALKTGKVMPGVPGAAPPLQGTRWYESTILDRYPELSALFARSR